MAKNLSLPEAFALAKLTASNGQAGIADLARLVESQLADRADARDALQEAKRHPDDLGAVSALAEHVRTHGRGKPFRTAVRIKVGSRKKVASLGVAQLVAMSPESNAHWSSELARVVGQKLVRNPGAQEALRAATDKPDDVEAISTLAEYVRTNIRNVRSLPQTLQTRPPGPPVETLQTRPPGPPVEIPPVKEPPSEKTPEQP